MDRKRLASIKEYAMNHVDGHKVTEWLKDPKIAHRKNMTEFGMVDLYDAVRMDIDNLRSDILELVLEIERLTHE